MMPPRKGVAILGSTGSIGTSTLALIARFEDRFRVVALAAGGRVAELKEQIERFAPEVVSVSDPRDAAELKRSLGARAPIISSGADGLRAVATAPTWCLRHVERSATTVAILRKYSSMPGRAPSLI